MIYHMRFFDTSPKPLTIAAIETALHVSDPAYRLEEAIGEAIPRARFTLGEIDLGELLISVPGDGMFEQVLREMRERLASTDDEYRDAVEGALASARRIIMVRMPLQEEEPEDLLAAIDPLWDWLFDSREGLLHADGEGFYQDGELILEEPETE